MYCPIAIGRGGGGGPVRTLDGNAGAVVVAAVSALSSAVTLVGLIVTTLMNWQKSRQDSARNALELEKLRLENEKLRRELDKGSSGTDAKK